MKNISWPNIRMANNIKMRSRREETENSWFFYSNVYQQSLLTRTDFFLRSHSLAFRCQYTCISKSVSTLQSEHIQAILQLLTKLNNSVGKKRSRECADSIEPKWRARKMISIGILNLIEQTKSTWIMKVIQIKLGPNDIRIQTEWKFLSRKRKRWQNKGVGAHYTYTKYGIHCLLWINYRKNNNFHFCLCIPMYNIVAMNINWY